MSHDDLIIQVESLKNMLVSHATGGRSDEAEYRRLRHMLTQDPRTSPRVPQFVKTCRSLDEFWGFIKPKFDRYHERRTFLREAFDPVLTGLEQGRGSAAQDHAAAILRDFSAEAIDAEFRKMLSRTDSDPEGAITSARTLLETVCKHVLDDLRATYEPDATLPALYGATATKLNLAPSQHIEKVFKQTLGGCFAVVEGIGAIRNALGDAHGQGRTSFRPRARHAQLVVNLASSAATFLVQTWQEQNVKTPTAS